jgi:hypothetical protein
LPKHYNGWFREQLGQRFTFLNFFTNDDGQCQRLGDLRHHFKRRGYNDKVIESGFSKASEIDRNDLLDYKEKKDQQTGSPVLTYYPSSKK